MRLDFKEAPKNALRALRQFTVKPELFSRALLKAS